MVYLILTTTLAVSVYAFCKICNRSVKYKNSHEPADSLLYIRHLIRQAGSVDELLAIAQQIEWLQQKYPNAKKECNELYGRWGKNMHKMERDERESMMDIQHMESTFKYSEN